jgi:hypothetical protein
MSEPTPIPMSADARQELEGLAADSERANRPRGLLLFGIALIAASVIFVLYALVARQSVAGQAQLRTEQAAQISTLVDKIVALRENQAKELGADRYAPNPLLAKNLEDLTRQVGLNDLRVTDAEAPPSGGRSLPNFSRRRYTISIPPATPQPAEGILALLERAPQEIKGLELSTLNFQPGANATVDGRSTLIGTIEFTRWERRN